MNDLLKAEAGKHGDRLPIINYRRLADLKKDIDSFARSEALNGFQEWIVSLEAVESGEGSYMSAISELAVYK